MEKKTLSNILEGKFFRIPDYQRGYAWEEKQWNDFIEDIDTLIDDKIVSHYTGTIVIYQPNTKPTEIYGTKKLEIIDIVDGQQRLTTCSLYLAIILNELVKKGLNDYNAEITNYLYSGLKTKMQLNNDTSDCYYDLITKGSFSVEAFSVHQNRLIDAYAFLKKHIDTKMEVLQDKGTEYLINIFDSLIRKLNFSFYTIEVESEIGMTFELMNSRGKDLSSLELLKNYFMYWIYRNINIPDEKEDFTSLVNKTWKEVFINIAKCNGNEDQCLRIVWTLFINYTPKNWDGYSGFKSDEIIPIRNFSINSKKKTRELLSKIVGGLSILSFHYAQILKPNENVNSAEEYKWLAKIRRAGNIAIYLPLLVAARIKYFNKRITEGEYTKLLQTIEKFTYRVFIVEGKRSNASMTNFFRWGWELFYEEYALKDIIGWILETINHYSNENAFRDWLQSGPDKWYEYYYRALKYTLYEYELYLLETDGKDVKPKLAWASISYSTIEHILPQTPEKKSKWLDDWAKEDIKLYLHDISNLVLTNDNSHYKNFDFVVKKGNPGEGHCYANSDIRQERKISEYKSWTVDSCKKRRKELVDWIIAKWGIDDNLE
ncbi:MAG: DUF262 domain-containing HNH endonuclease family protein [Spirochaetaceae bacterium]|jgi:hypothetical protein|nr:DUF262 domain-containing HNH endonuclease family protein [Spirochaetaceae bacterium]